MHVFDLEIMTAQMERNKSLGGDEISCQHG